MKIESEIRKFVAETFLPGTEPANIDPNMPLVTGGIIDSLGMLHLIDFLESRYAIEFLPREIDIHALDTVDNIIALIEKKLALGNPVA